MELSLQSTQENIKKILENAKNFLQNQVIDEQNPGTILKDFNTFLNKVKNEEINISGKNSLFSQKFLPELNSQLTNPTLIDLKRPVQKSYPYLNGIYLLLKITGLAEINYKGKQQQLILNEKTYQSWNQLNLTEKYLTLLEAWLIHSNDETLGESYGQNNLLRCILFWQQYLGKDKIKITKKNQDYFAFNHSPVLYNLALLDLFGLIKLKQGKPEKGKGWRVTEIEKTTYGNSLLSILILSLSESDLEKSLKFPYPTSLCKLVDTDLIEYGKLQKLLQPYFPQWQNNLILTQEKSSEGVYVFKVSLGKCWRQIAIPSHLNLDILAVEILGAFDFDNDHLYQFICRQRTGKTLHINHPYVDKKPFTDEFLVGDLPLVEGGKMTFLFDFGDNWDFDLILEEIQPVNPKMKKAKILKSYGEPPEQYGYDDEWDDDEE